MASANVCAIESCTNFGWSAASSNGMVFVKSTVSILGLLEHVDGIAGEDPCDETVKTRVAPRALMASARFGEGSAGRDHIVDDDRDPSPRRRRRCR